MISEGPSWSWPSLLAGTVVWAVIYNVLWILAWLAFMGSEWAGVPSMPWNTIWIVWATLSLPLGAASMAYVLCRVTAVHRLMPVSLAASLAVWIPLTVGMAVLGARDSLPFRTIALDSAVNYLTLFLATFTTAGLHRVARRPRKA